MKKLIVSAVAAVMLTACGGDNVSTQSSSSSNTLVYTQSSDFVSMDPHGVSDLYSRRAIFNMFNRLVEIDDDGNLMPGLAKSWEQVDDTTLLFNLRDDVTFHNGEPLTSEDVKYTLDRAVGSPVVAAIFQAIKEVEAPDEHTVIVRSHQPSASLLFHLSHINASIMNQKHNESVENIGIEPVGTGAFAFKEWRNGDRLTMVKNEDYFRGAPALDKVEMRIVPEETSRAIGLETGEAHIAADIETISRENIISHNDVELAEVSALGVAYMGLNMSKGATADLRVRRAIAYAIDKEAIINSVLMGAVENANTLLGPGVVGHSADTQELGYDVEKARQLMAEAGYADGLDMRLVTSNNELRRQMSEIIQAQLREIGINLSIEILEWSTFLSQTANGESDLFMLGWSNSSGDADYGMTPILHGSMIGSAGNRSFFRHGEFDSLLDQASVEMDHTARMALYAEAQDIMNKEVPIYPMYFMLANAGVRKEVSGYVQTAISVPDFSRITL